MRYRSLLEALLVVLACVASGTLECGGVVPTVQERRGEQLYARMCAVCHGRAGEGYAADQAPQLANRRFVASVSDDFLRSAIANGRSGTTMSAWSRAHSGPLGAGDIDGLMAMIHEWREGPRAVLDERPLAGVAAGSNVGSSSGVIAGTSVNTGAGAIANASASANANASAIDRGAEVFARECVKCHGALGTGGPNVHIGNFDLLSSASNGFLRYAIRGGRPGTAMPAFEAKLGDQGVEDVIALMRSWQAHATTAPHPAPPRPPPMPLGPVPLNPHGPEPVGFRAHPATTPAEAIKAQLDHGARMGILDARAPSDYLNEHIAGAVSVPFYDPDPYVAQLPRDAWLVCYCSCPHAESGSLAQKLAAQGFTKVTVLDEGLGFWKGKKFPTHTGIDP